MSAWDFGTMRNLRQVANDLTALSATLEVLRARQPHDVEVERARTFVERMIANVDAIVERLRER